MTRDPGADPNAPGNWPWLVSLTNGSHHFCSGSLINKLWVLTAASCMYRHPSNYTMVLLGRYNQSSLVFDDVSRGVVKIKCHPGYDSYTAENDICLLKLSAPVNFTAILRPVCLADEDSAFHSGEYSWVAEKEDMYEDDLQVLRIPVVEKNECACIHWGLVSENIVCAGSGSNGYDYYSSYEGDLGAPLIVKDHIFWVQFGIVSFGYGWTHAAPPRGFTRVSKYQDWIVGVVGNNSETGFVRFVSGGFDTDAFYTCLDDGRDDSVFDGGESAAGFSRFTHLAAACSLAMYLWVFG